ncbi:MAG: MFS transporter [Tagaea sp.]|nr:MFS transporter [Tagaea sp.]
MGNGRRGAGDLGHAVIPVWRLAALAALGPFASNLFLPAMPAMADGLATNLLGIQFALGAFFLAYAPAQLVAGPLADRYGRLRVLDVGLALFVAASLIAALVPRLDALIGARLVQGVGAAAILVAARAIARDTRDGKALVAAMAAIAIGGALVPAIVPLLAGLAVEAEGWRAPLIAGAAVAVVAALALRRNLTETAPAPSEESAWRGYAIVAADPVFRRNACIGAGAFLGLFAFFAGSPHVYIDILGVSPSGYGLYPPLAVVGFVAGALFAKRADARALDLGMTLLVAGAVAMLAAPLLGHLHRLTIGATMIVFVTGLGLLVPATGAAAMAPFKTRAGTASALLGAAQMAAAGLGIGLVALLQPAFPALAFPIAMALGATLAFAAYRTT